MALQKVTTFFPGGVGFYIETSSAGAPTDTAAVGSIAVVAVAGSVTFWICTVASGTWRQIPTSGTTSWLLQNDVNPALDIGGSSLTNLLRFITTIGAQQVVYNGAANFLLNAAGALIGGNVVGVAGFLRTAADGQADASIQIRKTFTAGASTTDFALPVRTAGGWRIVDAYIISAGATGGTLTVQTAAGAANVTNAMVPGNADVITRATSLLLANATFTSGATVRLAAAAGAPAGAAFLRIEPV